MTETSCTTLLNVETGSQGLCILSYAAMFLHPSVSMNNAKNCLQIIKDKIATCKKTASLRSGDSLDLDSTCLKVLVPAKIFRIQFLDMHSVNRFLENFRGHNMRPIW